MTRVLEQTWATVKAHFEIEGVHQFSAVEDMMQQQEDSTNIPFLDVSFLKHPHRHIFHFDIYVEVHHNDRDIEFIQLARLLREAMRNRYPPGQYGCANFENRSCEMLGEEVVNIFIQMFPQYYGKIMVEVSEDGENSAITLYNVYEEQLSEHSDDA